MSLLVPYDMLTLKLTWSIKAACLKIYVSTSQCTCHFSVVLTLTQRLTVLLFTKVLALSQINTIIAGVCCYSSVEVLPR